jgi:SNF2 family DNA or RNA helicase
MRLLKDKLENDGYSVGVINGEVKAHDRTILIRAFQSEPEPRILLIQPQAAAHGVTLTAADTVVWWAPTASLETYAQANARVHRSGQTNKCTVIRLQGSKIEQRMYKLLDNKIDVHTEMINLYKEILD